MDSRFTTAELMDRWDARREIMNTMVRFISQDYLFRREKDMYEKYWSKAEDVCLGVNAGYYSGAAAVKGYYAGIDAQTRLESRLIQQKYPTRLGDKSEAEVYGAGVLRMKPLDTPVVEIAGDGKTAKALYSVRATNVKLTPGGHVSYWEWGWIGVDFVLEKGEWKVWHMLYVQDIDCPTHQSWAEPAEEFPEDPAFQALRDFHFPEPNVKRPVRELYHPLRPFTPAPDYPVPYETFAETFSYGL